MILNRTSSRTRLRAHRLPDLVERLQLFDLAGQLDLPGLQRPHQVDVADHRRRLGGEGLEHRGRPVVERFHLGPPQADRSHDLAVEDERGADQGAIAAELLHVPPAVTRIAEDVADLLDAAVEGDPSGHRLAITTGRMGHHIAPELRRQPDGCGQLELVTVQEVDLDPLAPAQPPRALGHRVQHSVGFGGGPAQGDQHGVGGDQLLDHRGVVALQADVLLGGGLASASGHPPASPGNVER